MKENIEALTGLCEGNSPVTGEFPAQWASNAKKFPFDDVIMTTHLNAWQFESPSDLGIYIIIIFSIFQMIASLTHLSKMF